MDNTICNMPEVLETPHSKGNGRTTFCFVYCSKLGWNHLRRIPGWQRAQEAKTGQDQPSNIPTSSDQLRCLHANRNFTLSEVVFPFSYSFGHLLAKRRQFSSLTYLFAYRCLPFHLTLTPSCHDSPRCLPRRTSTRTTHHWPHRHGRWGKTSFMY